MSRTLQFTIGIAITALFVWLIVRHVDLASVGVALGQAHPGWIIGGVAIFFTGYSARVYRWRIMLSDANGGITWAGAFGPFMASMAANNVLPFRAGDVLRAFAFTKWLGQGAPAVLATLLVERLLDLLILLLALGLALTWFGMTSETAGQLVGMGAGGLMVLAFAVLAVLLFPGLLAPVVFWCISLLGKLSTALAAKIQGAAENVFATLKSQAHGPRMIVLIFWSLIAWTCEGLVFYCAARAVPALTDATAALLAFPVGTLSTLIPSTPGYLGTFDFFVIQSMQLLDNPAAAAAAFAVLVHLILWLPITILGGLSLLYLQAKGAFQRPTAST